jgi:hypothetical protein
VPVHTRRWLAPWLILHLPRIFLTQSEPFDAVEFAELKKYYMRPLKVGTDG